MEASSNGAIDWELFIRALADVEPALGDFLQQVDPSVRREVARALHFLLNPERRARVIARYAELVRGLSTD